MKTTLFLTFLILTVISFGQIETLKSTVDIYQPSTLNPGELALQIPVDFNGDDLLTIFPDSLNKLTVQRVDLVYSTFSSSSDFNQNQLNQNRIKALQAAWPNANDPRIAWQEIGQTAAEYRDQAKQLFHGFVIYYRPTPTAATIEKEMDYIDAILNGKTPKIENPVMNYGAVSDSEVREIELSEFLPIPKGGRSRTETISETVDYVPCSTLNTFTVKATSDQLLAIRDSLLLLPNCIQVAYKWSDDIAGEQEVLMNWLEQNADCEDAMTGADFEGSPISITFNTYNPGDYSIVEAVYKRHPNWQNTLIVMDVTGSMSPYIAQTMVWAKATQESEQVKAYTFFNDGNRRADHLKQTGKVGGVYSTQNETFDTVYETMKMTMSKGGGGDCPENNIEATLKATTEFPESGEIVMVADNWATPRDLELVGELDQPVHVILCGASYGINADYIQLAYDTGGSVHTIEEDLEMRGIKPGKTFRLGGTYFTLFNGKIEVARNKSRVSEL